MSMAKAIPIRKALLASLLAIGLADLLFSLPAVYNGFPFVFHDTPWYLFLKFHPMRTPYYSLLILPLHWKMSLWPVVFGQALILAHLLYLTLRVAFGTVDLPRYLVLCLILTLCTSLPWFAGQIMPDVLTAVVVLASFLLAFGIDRMHRLEVAYVFLLLTGAITVHLSHVPLSLGLLLVALGYKALFLPSEVLRPAPFALQAGAIAIAVAGLVLANAVVFGNFSLSPGGKLFLMARSIADGPGRQYLEEICPEKHYRLCDYLGDMNGDSDHILWKPEGPVSKAGGYQQIIPEADAIFRGAVERYPGWHLRMALSNFAEQLVTFGTGAELGSYLWKPSLGEGIERGVPGSAEGYSHSRQTREELPLSTLRLIGNFSARVSLVLAAASVVILWRRRDWQALALLVMVAAALIGNAMISGIGSGPHDRYQSRVVWLLTFAAVAGVLYAFPRRGRTRGQDAGASRA